MFWEISGKKFKNYGGLAEPNLMTKFLIRQFINNYFINFEICEFSPYWPQIFFSDRKSISIIIFGLFLSVKFFKISKFKNTVSYPFYSMSIISCWYRVKKSWNNGKKRFFCLYLVYYTYMTLTIEHINTLKADCSLVRGFTLTSSITQLKKSTIVFP